MTWKEIKDIAWFVLIFVLAVRLIEYEAGDLLVEMAGDVFGSLGLMYIAVSQTLDSITN